MKGIDKLSLSAGIVLVVVGFILLVGSFVSPFLLFYALPALIIGIVILATLRQQEYIEPIRETIKRRKK